MNSSLYTFGGSGTYARSNILYQIDMGAANVPALTEMSVAGALPLARDLHSMTNVGQVLYVAGGVSSGVFLSDTWILDLNEKQPAWVKGPVLPYGALYGHAAAALDNTIWSFGGRRNEAVLTSDLITMKTAAPALSWGTQSYATASAPAARWKHGMVARDDIDELYLFGGEGLQGILYNDLWVLHTRRKTLEWQQVQTVGDISARRSFGMAAIGTKLYVAFGMTSDGQAVNDLWAIDISNTATSSSSPTWVRMIMDGADDAPAQRHSLTMAAYKGTLLVIGGQHPVSGALSSVLQADVCSPLSCPQGQTMSCGLGARNRGVCSECLEGRMCCHQAPYTPVVSSDDGICTGMIDKIMVRGCARSQQELSDKVARARLDRLYEDTMCNNTVESICQSFGGAGAKELPLLCSKVKFIRLCAVCTGTNPYILPTNHNCTKLCQIFVDCFTA
jgi:hypothetical protein